MTPTLTLRHPADLAAAIPYLLGFHPADSLVVVGLRDTTVTVVQRWDLDLDVDGLAGAIAEVLDRSVVETVLLAAYGELAVVGPVLECVRGRLPVPLLAAVRVTGDRCFCASCEQCTPPDGFAFDAAASPIPAEATVAGLTALPDRDSLRDQVAPVTGQAARAMSRAVDLAGKRLVRLIQRAWDNGVRDGQPAVRAAGFVAVDGALAAGRRGVRLTDEQIAWLTLLLHSLPVRDRAWESTDHEPWQLSLWTDVTRRADPELAAPPATLLAFAAWRDGNGPLAGVALDRALTADADYSLAKLIQDAMLRGLPGSTLGRWPSQRSLRDLGVRRGRSTPADESA
ncbi:MAG: DUF4192 domain-containing protein [Hamadaea sp.]|uniref:DUF4192 domain-containing protein n=1 Tax=Hamadaea sp. TaxID=2024425 RepID=UPI001804CAA3|nr:DUF4192 domain-containing protein [Hamadaea sp.]NUR71206.1 DUF4192 domain-containing protein [Hamadaea sp.]NUT17737.1 DUF4192 domain-containing protein [Hamadaea sp.]